MAQANQNTHDPNFKNYIQDSLDVQDGNVKAPHPQVKNEPFEDNDVLFSQISQKKLQREVIRITKNLNMCTLELKIKLVLTLKSIISHCNLAKMFGINFYKKIISVVHILVIFLVAFKELR